MRRHRATGRKPAKAQQTIEAKRGGASKAARQGSRSGRNLQEKLDARTRQLNEAIKRENASAEVLRIISNSPSDLEPVFDAILANATRLCEAQFGVLWLCEADGSRRVAVHNAPPEYQALRRRNSVHHPAPNVPLGRLARTKQVIRVADTFAEPAVRVG